MGFGMYTKGNDGEFKDNLMYELVDDEKVNKNIVTYNITFNSKGNCDGSYIQLGDISRRIQEKVTWLQSPGWEDWGLTI